MTDCHWQYPVLQKILNNLRANLSLINNKKKTFYFDSEVELKSRDRIFKNNTKNNIKNLPQTSWKYKIFKQDQYLKLPADNEHLVTFSTRVEVHS